MFTAGELSDGTLRYLCLLAVLLSPRPPELLALNEPETSIHADLLEPLQAAGVPVWKVGGAEKAGELDAKRAIDQGSRLAATVESAESGAVYEQPLDTGAKIFRVAQQYMRV